MRAQIIEGWRLYILMRTDLESMTPGKAMAQACHVGSQFYKEWGEERNYKTWARMSNGFGTTIVLNGDNDTKIRDVIGMAKRLANDRKNHKNIFYGIVTDDTYPIRDGFVTHYVPLITCGYVFIHEGDDEAINSTGLISLDLLQTPYNLNWDELRKHLP